MSTIIATLEYRTHVPYGWIASEFCNLNVMGVSDSEVKGLEDSWHDIEFEKYRAKEIIIDKLENDKDRLNAEVDSLESQYKASKKWYRFANKAEKQMLADAHSKRMSIYEIDEQIQKHKDERFFSASELKRKAEQLLINKGYILISKSSAGAECITHTEIWQKNI